MSDKTVAIFDAHPPGFYDESTKHFATALANLHFLSAVVLQRLPANARILSVGVGTGTELIGLARAYPGWTFDGIDPSKTMLADCRQRLADEGLTKRCRLTQGYLRDVKESESYDAVLCFLVMHFLKDETDKLEMFRGMHQRLNPGGYLVTAEISCDQASPQFPDILEHWVAMLGSGGSQQATDGWRKMIRDNLGVMAPEATERLLRAAGFAMPVQFAQSLLIRAWYARK